MTDQVLISVQNINKMYWLYSHYHQRLQQRFLGPLLGRAYAHAFWALRNISFDLKEGKVLGVIGRNGSGKSTLLEIVAGTLRPSSGSVQTNGRLTALLELGAGFHPEFTGRENVFLSGATMGISEAEMKRRYDEIVDFAQIGEFIDQPVKLYSSGMYVRLAFAVTTCVDPDIFVVDEALAVGDTGFVVKCINRIKRLKDKGTCILLVTHDIQTVRTLCDDAIWLHEGVIQAAGSPLDVTSQYVQFLFKETSSSQPQLPTPVESRPQNETYTIQMNNLSEQPDLIRWGSGELRITSCLLTSEMSGVNTIFEYGHPIKVYLEAQALVDIPSEKIGFGFAFRNLKGLDIITSTTLDQGNTLAGLKAGQHITVTFSLQNILAPGNYALVLNVEDRTSGAPKYYDFIENAFIFTVVSNIHIFSVVLPSVTQEINLRQP